jgi:protein-S-isoprenylcysteine O-methyltransferase Ste14
MTTTWQAGLRWVKSTPNRTFVVFPLGVAAFEALRQGGMPADNLWGAVFLLWGYLQYRLIGRDRRARGGGGPGIEAPPDRIVTDGAYRYLRNPMYLGHLIFMLGLVVTFSSGLAAALLVFHAGWFHVRVLRDEQRLESRFGDVYRDYKARVKRWIPGVL